MKFSNEEIEKLFLSTTNMHDPYTCFKAGFQKCLEMLKERMPTDIEISREYGRKGIVRDFILERLEGKR